MLPLSAEALRWLPSSLTVAVNVYMMHTHPCPLALALLPSGMAQFPPTFRPLPQ